MSLKNTNLPVLNVDFADTTHHELELRGREETNEFRGDDFVESRNKRIHLKTKKQVLGNRER